MTAIDVANLFILHAWAEGRDIDTISLQKLVYIAYGFHAGITGKPLFEDKIEAWSYGPVIPNLYKRLVKYGAGNVRALL